MTLGTEKPGLDVLRCLQRFGSQAKDIGSLSLGETVIVRKTQVDKDVREAIAARQVPHTTSHEDYLQAVVQKPWGHEFLVYHNDHAAVWLLKINQRHGTSMHCHPSKVTSLTVLSGHAIVSGMHFQYRIGPLASIRMEPGVFHKIQTNGSDVVAIETEAPSSRADLLRLNDRYGREKLGYEGSGSLIRTNLDQYGHFHLNPPDLTFTQTSPTPISIRVTTFQSSQDLQRFLYETSPQVVHCCQGEISCGNDILAQVGEATSIPPSQIPQVKIRIPTTILSLASPSGQTALIGKRY